MAEGLSAGLSGVRVYRGQSSIRFSEAQEGRFSAASFCQDPTYSKSRARNKNSYRDSSA